MVNLMTTTTTGRVIFNDIIPEELGFMNEVLDKKAIARSGREMLSTRWVLRRSIEFLDNLKRHRFWVRDEERSDHWYR